MPKPKMNNDHERIDLVAAKGTKDRLLALKNRTGVKSMTQVMTNAIELYETLLALEGQIMVRSPEGVYTIVVIPGKEHKP